MGATTTSARGERTRERVLLAALTAFGTDGVDGTSLDSIAADLDIRKQTILYYFPSKQALLAAVLDHVAAEVVVELEATLVGAGSGFDRVERIVRTVFRVAVRRPEVLGLVREAGRIGPTATGRLTDALEPLVERATAFLEVEMEAGTFRASDPRLLLVSCYATVIGVATEVAVLEAVGIEPSLRATVLRRRELLEFLRSALMAHDRG